MTLHDILSPYAPPLNRMKPYTASIQKNQVSSTILGHRLIALDLPDHGTTRQRCGLLSLSRYSS